jgi:hypothetical protein
MRHRAAARTSIDLNASAHVQILKWFVDACSSGTIRLPLALLLGVNGDMAEAVQIRTMQQDKTTLPELG